MDIGAHNYPFQCFFFFSNVEITPTVSVNHDKSQKIYFEPQLFTQQKNISYKETFVPKISFFFNFNYESICPHQIFLLVLAIILTQEICNQKKSVKNVCFVIFV